MQQRIHDYERDAAVNELLVSRLHYCVKIFWQDDDADPSGGQGQHVLGSLAVVVVALPIAMTRGMAH